MPFKGPDPPSIRAKSCVRGRVSRRGAAHGQLEGATNDRERDRPGEEGRGGGRIRTHLSELKKQSSVQSLSSAAHSRYLTNDGPLPAPAGFCRVYDSTPTAVTKHHRPRAPMTEACSLHSSGGWSPRSNAAKPVSGETSRPGLPTATSSPWTLRDRETLSNKDTRRLGSGPTVLGGPRSSCSHTEGPASTDGFQRDTSIPLLPAHHQWAAAPHNARASPRVREQGAAPLSLQLGNLVVC